MSNSKYKTGLRYRGSTSSGPSRGSATLSGGIWQVASGETLSGVVLDNNSGALIDNGGYGVDITVASGGYAVVYGSLENATVSGTRITTDPGVYYVVYSRLGSDFYPYSTSALSSNLVRADNYTFLSGAAIRYTDKDAVIYSRFDEDTFVPMTRDFELIGGSIRLESGQGYQTSRMYYVYSGGVAAAYGAAAGAITVFSPAMPPSLRIMLWPTDQNSEVLAM